MKGSTELFAREDGVEAAWRIVDRVLDDQTPLFFYQPGTWGPEEAISVPLLPARLVRVRDCA